MEKFEEIPKNFASPDQELSYWKERAVHYQKKFEEQRDEFDDYVKFSKEVEQELDLELKQKDSQIKELQSHRSRVLNENESLRNRNEQMNAEYTAQLSELQADLSSFRTSSDELSSYVRILEQNNDDLERANRTAAVSIEDFETKLNQAIERNAFLEAELDEKETLKTMVQRLKDETKDLQGELVLRRGAGTPVLSHHHPDNKEIYKTANGTNPNVNNQQPDSCNRVARSTPLTVVNDLLRKVGVLESKLQTRVSYNKDQQSLRRKLHNEFN